jgi:hypothetical protein
VILRTKISLVVEFLAIFVAIPLALALGPQIVPPIPVLWLAAAYGLIALYRDPNYRRSELWNPGLLRRQLPSMLLLFAMGVAVIGALVYEFAHPVLFSFVRTHPVVWALVMILYPVLSVYPQGILFRAFLLHRYRDLFGASPQKETALIFLSAVSFSLMHVVFRNWIAVALTFAGGVLFARRHLATRSLFVSSFEHAIYGCFIFTIGLGQYFFAKLV